MKAALSRQPTLANQHSIRWRLPLSYAGIALLTAAVLAGLLLVPLNSYYNEREHQYLDWVAGILARQIEGMYRDNLAADQIQSGVGLYSFLAQARVQLLDENQQVVADSGEVAARNDVTVYFPQQEQPAPMFIQTDEFQQSPEPYLSIPPAPPQEEQDGDPSAREGRYFFRIWSGPLRAVFTDNAPSEERSSQRVTVPIYGSEGKVLGYLQLSDGPAFGSEIVRDVAERGIVAGLIAVLIAIGAGAIVSRNISQPVLILAGATRAMAQGNLATRVNLKRRDEFDLLAKTFNAMAERVENTINTLRQFVEDAAHEINTPLTALRTNLELTALYDIPGSARADIQQALTELMRLEKLTRSLLMLARLEAPDMALQRSPVDLVTLVRHMYERYASRAEQAGVELTLEVPGEPVILAVDQAQITRVLDNLLDNALKFTPTGGQVTIGLHAADHRVRCWVRDTGIGIPENDLPKLFSRFHRARNAAAYPGNGLGLVITRAIVEEHGGQITVESYDGSTCFTVSLPGDSKGQST